MAFLAPEFPGVWRNHSNGYRYFLPGSLSMAKNIVLPMPVIRQLEDTALALGEFRALIDRIPNPASFIRAYTNKEAELSSRIEGTQTQIEDAFKSEEDVRPEKRNDWAEVQAYIQAARQATDNPEKLPLCNRLINETHERLLAHTRGKNKLPGEHRRSQNWIGGSRPGNARFVPPPPERVGDLMSDLELFIQDRSSPFPVLVNAALIHYQFETIHPFLDGNGRMGRMLILLYLLEKEFLKHPVLHISSFLEAHRLNYYDALERARQSYEGVVQWISFFLDAVEYSAKNGIAVTLSLIAYDQHLREQQLPQLGRREKSALRLLEFLYLSPVVNARLLQKKLEFSPQVSQGLLSRFVEMDILREITGYRRNRIFMFHPYLELLRGDPDEKEAE